MTHEFDVQVTAANVKSAWNAWFFKSESWWKLALGMALLGTSVSLDLSDGHLNTLSIIGLTILGLTPITYVAFYFIGLQKSIKRLAFIQAGKAHYTLSDSTIQATSSLGSVSLGWAALSEVRRYPKVILLLYRGSGYSTLPAAQVPAEAMVFLLQQACAHGAKIS